jgi:hypothetical protein
MGPDRHQLPRDRIRRGAGRGYLSVPSRVGRLLRLVDVRLAAALNEASAGEELPLTSDAYWSCSPPIVPPSAGGNAWLSW